jgi:type II secretory pathway pseudopilin PulG
MTLIELLVSLVVGSVIIMAAFTVLDTSVTQAGKVADRVDATQRGRLALDELARQLHSQVCLQHDVPAIVAGSGSSITFYTFAHSGAFRPERHTYTWDPTARTIVEQAYQPTGLTGALVYPLTPTSTRTLLTDVVASGADPIFDYYTWSTSGQVLPSLRLAAPLSATDLARVVRVVISFRAEPTRAGSKQGVALQTEVYSRTANPNGSAGPETPLCI